MKKLLCAIILSALILTPCFADELSVTLTDSPEVFRSYINNKNSVMLDLRPEAAYMGWKIDNAARGGHAAGEGGRSGRRRCAGAKIPAGGNGRRGRVGGGMRLLAGDSMWCPNRSRGLSRRWPRICRGRSIGCFRQRQVRSRSRR